MMKNRALLVGLMLLAVSWQGAVHGQTPSYGIDKTINYDQSGTATPTIDPQQPYSVYLDAGFYTGDSEGSTILPSSTLALPSGATGVVAFSEEQGTLQFNQNFLTLTELNTAFPNGTYTMTLNTVASGASAPTTLSSTVTITGNDYPVTPKITNTNWTGGRLVIDPTKSFTFTWPAFTGSNSGDTINFQIENGGNVNQTVPADGAHNSYVLAANTLAPNTFYTGVLQFSDFEAGSSGTSLPGGALFYRQVYFVIQTGTVAPPSSTLNYIFKDKVLTQTSMSAPVAATGTSPNPGPYVLEVHSPIAGEITGPTSTAYTLLFNAQERSGGNYEYYSDPDSLSTLTSSYPDGTYTLSDGVKVSLSGDVYPNTPQVTLVNGHTPVWNAAGQLVLNPNIANTFTWSAFTSTNANYNFTTGGNEYFQVSGNNANVSQSSSLGSPAFNTYTVPAQALSDGNVYQGEIVYELASALSMPTMTSTDLAGYQTNNNFAVLALKPALNGVIKQAVKVQTSTSSPVGAPASNVFAPGPYDFFAKGTNPGSVSGPNGGSQLLYISGEQDYDFVSGAETSTTSLNTAYPDGTYTLSNGGTVSLSGDVYPSVPQVTLVNGATPVWTSGQLVLNPLIANTITFSAYTGSNANYKFSTGGTEIAEVYGNQDSVDVTQRAFGPEGDSTFTTLTIPANTLTTGNTYTGDLQYILDSYVSFADPTTNTYNFAGYSHVTYYTIAATPPPQQTYLVDKQAVKVQTSNSAPVSGSGNSSSPGPYDFYASATAATSLTGPNGTYTLSLDTNDQLYKYVSPSETSVTNLNAAYPDGTYTFSNSGSVTLSGDVYPSIPQVTLVDGATPVWSNGQLVLTASQAHTITFSSYAGRNANYNFSTGGDESAEVYGNQDSYDNYQTASGLNGGSPFNTITIPANSLTVGHTYTGHLNYYMASSVTFVPATNTYTVAGYSHQTFFIISAIASGVGD